MRVSLLHGSTPAASTPTPRTNKRNRPARLLLALLALATLVTIAASPAHAARAHIALVAPAINAGAPSPAAALALRVLAAGDDGVAATAEIFARAGIASLTQNGDLQSATPPALPMTLPWFAIKSMASDAAQRANGGYRLSLDELATALAQAGWSVPQRQTAGQALAAVLAQAITTAQQNSADPHSFTPLLLAAMAQAGSPTTDLTAKTLDPRVAHLSLLEAELLLTAHLRGNASYPADGNAALPSGPAASLIDSLRRAVVGIVAPSAAVADGPCSDLEDNLGAFKALHLVALDKLSGIPLDAIYSKLGLSALDKFAVSKFMAIMQILAAAGDAQFSMSVDPTQQHYSHGASQTTLSSPPGCIRPLRPAATRRSRPCVTA